MRKKLDKLLQKSALVDLWKVKKEKSLGFKVWRILLLIVIQIFVKMQTQKLLNVALK
jgi:hypothetical protein